MLFSIYEKVIVIEALEDFEEGILKGYWYTDVKSADDQRAVPDSEKGLQKLMNKLNDTAKKINMKISFQKQKQ